MCIEKYLTHMQSYVQIFCVFYSISMKNMKYKKSIINTTTIAWWIFILCVDTWCFELYNQKKKYKNEKQNLIKTWVDRSEVKICDYINKYELKINKIFIKFSP